MDPDRKIEARGWELIGLVSAKLPRESEVTGDADAWPMIAAALTSRITGTMRSILRLLPDGVETDAGILLRTLYDHAVTLAWLAADPAPLAYAAGERMISRSDSRLTTTRETTESRC